ncbi:ComF family protein [Leptotrichia sp. OH3620_COT-345]|nr:ComF family protein [Leptotrichia sp. OH3620_COT-345]
MLKTTDIKFDFCKIIYNFKSLFFKNKDVISGEELAEYGIVSKKTENRLLQLKKLRQLNNIYYIWDYNDDFKKMIFSYKYKRKKKLAELIARLINEEFRFILQRERIDLIVSVPINKKRKSERGYNQVDEILKCLNIRYIQLKRVRNTEKMHKLLNEELRIKNIKGSFSVNKNVDFKNKRILIVDDIITTGSTLREIKKSILEAADGKEKKSSGETIISVFCLAAAREIKINKGEI